MIVWLAPQNERSAKKHKGIMMKTTSDEILTQENDSAKSTLKVNAQTTKPLKSFRPMKSIVRASSLRPKRIQVGAKLRRKAIKA